MRRMRTVFGDFFVMVFHFLYQNLTVSRRHWLDGEGPARDNRCCAAGGTKIILDCSVVMVAST